MHGELDRVQSHDFRLKPDNFHHYPYMFLCTITLIFLQQVSAAQLLISYQVKVTQMRESAFAYGCRSLSEAERK